MDEFAAWIRGEGPDPLYREAVEAVRKNNRASVSLVQRVLKIGYIRASGFIEQMEADGIVSAPEPIRGERRVLPASVEGGR